MKEASRPGPHGRRRARRRSRRPGRPPEGGDEPPSIDAARQIKFRDPGAARRAGADALPRDRGHRAGSRVGHARVRKPRAGHRAVRAARVLPPGLERDHGPRLPGLHHRSARGGRGRGAGAARAWRWRPTATCCGSPGPAARSPTRRPKGLRSKSCTARRRPSSWRARRSEEVVFFATGFETTAVATAAIAKGNLPANFSILSAHKYIPPVMEIVAEMPGTKVEGFLAAGHAATITGWGIFESFVERHRNPRRGRRLRAPGHPGRPGRLGRARPRRHAARGQHVSALRDQGGQPPGPAGAVERVRAAGRALARHRPRPQRKPAACATNGRTWTRASASRST